MSEIISASVRASAIREAVERMTDDEMLALCLDLSNAESADDERALLLGALTRREETAT